MARIEAVSRRVAGRRIERTTFSSEHMLLDFDHTEWDVLKTLLAEPGIVVEYSNLKEQAWGSTTVSYAAVHMAIRRLRLKLKQDLPDNADVGLIISHRGHRLLSQQPLALGSAAQETSTYD